MTEQQRERALIGFFAVLGLAVLVILIAGA